MFPWLMLPLQSALLALESQQVVALRLARIARGGTDARTESLRMCTEKVTAGADTMMLLAFGGHPATAVNRYRRRVRANARRLGKTR